MSLLAENKRAKYDYNILETYEAGIELLGFEVKSIKSGRINLSGSYVVIKENQAWLINADIPPYQPKNMPEDYDSKRTRRLLLKRAEINTLVGKTHEKGLTLIPLKVYTKNASGRIKIEFGLGRSRKKADKREVIKKKDAEKEIRNTKF